MLLPVLLLTAGCATDTADTNDTTDVVEVETTTTIDADSDDTTIDVDLADDTDAVKTSTSTTTTSTSGSGSDTSSSHTQSMTDIKDYIAIDSEDAVLPVLAYHASLPRDEVEMGQDPQPGDLVAVITTPQGVMKAKLFTQGNPEMAGNFARLAARGYYDGLIFHRVIQNFMIQGGDPTGTGTGGESADGGKINDSFNDNYSNTRGSLSMANAGPNTNGSQFFINQGDNSFLDHNKDPLTSKHAVFAEVYEGLDVLDAIAQVQTGMADKPVEDVTMQIDVYLVPTEGASTVEQTLGSL